jgi:hypothetical protein
LPVRSLNVEVAYASMNCSALILGQQKCSRLIDRTLGLPIPRI